MNTLTRFFVGTVGLLLLLKAVSFAKARASSALSLTFTGTLFYFFAWPGMRPESFVSRRRNGERVGSDFVAGLLCMLAAGLAQVVLFATWTDLPKDSRGYLGIASFLLGIHLGLASVLFAVLRILGWPVERLFDAPWRADSLRNFWSHRWNLAFVDMDRRIFLPLFPKSMDRRLAVFGIFVVSGLLHEVGISFPAGGGYGFPFLYFLLHAVFMAVEPRVMQVLKKTHWRRLWVWGTLLAPVPLLFHSVFIEAIIEPYFAAGEQLVRGLDATEILHSALIICGLGHFLVLAASFQVPTRLNWGTELARLGRFNRKIFWTYGGYIVFCIVAFGCVDLIDREGLLQRHPSSLAIASFIAMFWTIRVVVDFTYFKHDDWPAGDEFVAGHACLTTLFVTLALTHWAVVAWQLGFFA